MKGTRYARSRRQRSDPRVQKFSLRSAKANLGRLIEKARRGETIYIIRGRYRFILLEAPKTPPIPVRPPNYFADAYSRAEIREDNRLAKSSIIRAPEDLE